MSGVQRTNHVDGDNAASAGGGATRAGTRRSWLAGMGAVFAVTAVSSANTFGPASADSGLPQSVWPYETPGMQFVLEARVSIAPVIEFGEMSHGHRRIIPITGGTFHGPHLSGTVLDEGEDTQVVRADGVTEIAARYTLRTNDGVLIYVINRGIIVPPDPASGKGTAAASIPAYVRTIPALEAPRGGRYAWLNRALYVGTLNPLSPSQHAVVVRFFKVT